MNLTINSLSFLNALPPVTLYIYRQLNYSPTATHELRPDSQGQSVAYLGGLQLAESVSEFNPFMRLGRRAVKNRAECRAARSM